MGTLNTYQVLLILPSSLKEDNLNQAVERVSGEVTRLGGQPGEVQRVGSRVFARRMGKQDAGQYVRLRFALEAGNVAALQSRLALNEDVFRAQIRRTPERPAAEEAATEEGRAAHGEC